MEQQFLLSGIKINELLERIAQLIDSKLEKASPTTENEKHQSEYITRNEVAKLLRVSLPTLHDWTKQRWLQSYKIGNRVLYKRHEIENSITQVQFQKYKKGGMR